MKHSEWQVANEEAAIILAAKLIMGSKTPEEVAEQVLDEVGEGKQWPLISSIMVMLAAIGITEFYNLARTLQCAFINEQLIRMKHKEPVK